MAADPTLTLTLTGHVQGVGLRWWASRRMAELSLTGSATNLPDGSVEIVAGGRRADLERLVRAVREGEAPGAVESADVRWSEPDGAEADERVDVLVVGGGPAGLSAALVLGRSRRRVLVVDGGRPRNAAAGHMQGYLGRDGLAPAEFLALGREEVRRYGVEVRAGRVERLLPEVERSWVEVRLEGGGLVRARRVIVATGLRDVLPDVPGIGERWGRDVLHCPYCHGWEVRDSAMAVIAATPDEADKAITMTQWSWDVALVLDGTSLEELGEARRRRLTALGVAVLEGEVAGLVVEDDAVTGLRLSDGRVHPCATVVVQPTVVACDELLTAVGAEVEEGPFGRFVVTDETGATGVPGIWVAGNVGDPQAQVVIAAAGGYRAALAVDHDLILEDADRAVGVS